jgi:putative ABC transport system permease protein
MKWFSGVRARLHLLFARRAAEARIDEEIGLHIELETSRLVREEQLSPEEARRRALATFGGITHHTEALRDGRGLAWLGGLSLDLRLGLRMLRKYPGLTAVGSLAMAFAIWVGAVTFEMVMLIVHPTLPLPGGDRIVQIRNWDVQASSAVPAAPRDFVIWREALTAVTDLGAYRDITRNLIAGPGDVRPVQVAEITASAFLIAPSRPLLGRVLVAADERAGAPPVVVIGYDVWRTRFASDPAMVGRTVQLGDRFATVVGVMPEGFAFPMSHALWTPLQADVLDGTPGEGAGINVFGRLAPGVTLREAQAQLTTLGRRSAEERPDTHEHLRPQVLSYTTLFFEPTPETMGLMYSIPVFAVMLLVLVCGNVALLLFARAATRENELIVRSALGATRGRIIAQLFAEALVLGAVAAGVGLAAAHVGLSRWGREYLELNVGTLPFWYDPRLSPATVLYVIGLTVLSAAIAGVVPALKITRGLGSRLRQGTAGGGGPRFGGIWTAVIVAQVAVTVAFPAVAYVEQQELRRIQSFDVGFAAEEHLAVRLEMDAATPPGASGEAAPAERARFGAMIEALRRQVAEEPGVAGVTFIDRLPRMYHRERRIELDDASDVAEPADRAGAPDAPLQLPEVSIATIDPSYFEVLQTPVLAGRAFNAGDLARDPRVVIVDQGFVDQVLAGRNAIGRRVRFAAVPNADGSSAEAPGPWYEIVGVVKELGMGYVTHRGRASGVYLPTDPEGAGLNQMIVHAQGDPMSLGPRVRAIAAALDPALQLSELQRLDRVTDGVLWFLRLWIRITVLMTAIALLLSLAGIYAVLSFTVARRTREIGVRVALGANRRRVVAAIFRRPLTQVVLGVAAGGALIAAAAIARSGGGLALGQVALLVVYAAFMLGVCLLACVVPTLRALRVEPTVALAAE